MMKKLILPLFLTLFIFSCKKSDESSPQERLDKGESPLELYTSGVSIMDIYGLNYQGGRIFYLNTTTGSGLVVTAQDVGNDVPWGCDGTLLTGCDNDQIGDGLNNSLSISSSCSDANIAAKVCLDLVHNGYDDWYLPSIGELEQMNIGLHEQLTGNLSYGYWSSTQNDASQAMIFDFAIPLVNSRNKSINYSIRAIRSF